MDNAFITLTWGIALMQALYLDGVSCIKMLDPVHVVNGLMTPTMIMIFKMANPSIGNGITDQ